MWRRLQTAGAAQVDDVRAGHGGERGLDAAVRRRRQLGGGDRYPARPAV